MINMTEEQKNTKKTFWTFGRFIIANLLVLLLLFLGKNVGYVPLITGVFADFWISAPFLWYLVVSLVWVFVLATYGTQLVKHEHVYMRHQIPMLSAMWSVSLILGWFLFLSALRWYVLINIAL